MWTNIFIALTAILCVFCLTGCIFVAQNATRESESVRRRLRSCELQTESLQRSVEETQQAMTDLANSQKMQRVRAATRHGLKNASGEPDPHIDPEGWRAWKNRQLQTGVVN